MSVGTYIVTLPRPLQSYAYAGSAMGMPAPVGAWQGKFVGLPDNFFPSTAPPPGFGWGPPKLIASNYSGNWGQSGTETYEWDLWTIDDLKKRGGTDLLGSIIAGTVIVGTAAIVTAGIAAAVAAPAVEAVAAPEVSSQAIGGVPMADDLGEIVNAADSSSGAENSYMALDEGTDTTEVTTQSENDLGNSVNESSTPSTGLSTPNLSTVKSLGTLASAAVTGVKAAESGGLAAGLNSILTPKQIGANPKKVSKPSSSPGLLLGLGAVVVLMVIT
jgi:hypothetical protein